MRQSHGYDIFSLPIGYLLTLIKSWNDLISANYVALDKLSVKMNTYNTSNCGFRTVVQLTFIYVMVIWKRACPDRDLFKT